MPNPMTTPPKASPDPALREFAWIARYFRPLAAGFAGSFNLSDDAAVLAVPPGFDQVVTADAVVAGSHFFADDAPDAIAKKALRCNLSDLAAKGARPWLYNLCLALPKNVTEDWLAQFCQGLAADQAEFAISLLGGDTVAVPHQANGTASGTPGCVPGYVPGPLMVAITAIGLVRPGTMIRRNGAKPGDEIWVTGTIGDAALGLDLILNRYPGINLADGDDKFLRDRYALPQPRLGFAAHCAEYAEKSGKPLFHAGLDISDGLVADLTHMAEESGVDIEIMAASVPISPAARSVLSLATVPLGRWLNGGDDYELALAAAPENHHLLMRLGREAELPLTRIGCAKSPRQGTAPKCRVLDHNGQEMGGQEGAWAESGFRHF
ncbi:MAG: thiamine-phosphate kinase [Candidatus Symbiobacter sp.]|nr:thiamine-phosphate kinase [Candidatus Symbiobacter sp.]